MSNDSQRRVVSALLGARSQPRGLLGSNDSPALPTGPMGGIIPLGLGNIGQPPQVQELGGIPDPSGAYIIKDNGLSVLVPSISSDGYLLTPQSAEREYKQTGRHYGKFRSAREADDYWRIAKPKQ